MNAVNRHVNLIESAIASQTASALVASWRRSSATHKLDPAEFRPPHRVTDQQMKEARQLLEPLLRIADPVLDRLINALGGAGCCVLLADSNGVPIARRVAPVTTRRSMPGGCGRAPSGARVQEELPLLPD